MGQMKVNQSVTINKSRTELFQFLKHVKNQNKFSVWNMADPDQKTSFEGTDGEVGFIYSWDSQKRNVGAGSQEIKNIDPENRIDFELRFVRPMKNVGNSSFILKEIDETTTEVSWDFNGPVKFPFSLFKGYFQKTIAKDLASSLNKLKEIQEA